MAANTKFFVRFANLKALEFTCRNCEATVTIPFDETPFNGLNECPHCNAHWDVSGSNSFSGQIHRLRALYRSMAQALNGPTTSTLGYTVCIELKLPSESSLDILNHGPHQGR